MSKDKHTFNTNTLKNNYNSQTNMFFSDAIEQWNKEQDMFLQQNTAELEAKPVSGKKFITSLGSTLSGIFHNKKLFPCIILVFYIALIFHMLDTVLNFIKSVYFIDTVYFNYSSVNVILWLCLPIIMFIWSTCFKSWNFHMRKHCILWLTTISLIFEMVKYVYLISFSIFVPLLIKLPLVRGVTCAMVLYLIRLVLLLCTLGFVVWMLVFIFNLFSNTYTKKDIETFRLNNYVNKNAFAAFDKYAYNVSAIWRMSSGFRFVIGEADRFLHMLVNGVTGSGKTSSMLIPMIVDDMDTKVRNEDTLKKKLVNAVKKGKITLNEPFKDEDFSLKYFSSKEGYEDLLFLLQKKYRSAGMTIMAPDASLTDQVYDFCMKRNIPCNRIDPEPDTTTMLSKEGCVGFNPLLMPKGITKNHPRYHTLVVQKATLFADVIQAIAELGGKSEQYFASINRNIITAFVILLELTYEETEGKPPTPENLQEWINDFSRVQPYHKLLVSNTDLAKKYKFVVDFINYDILGAGQKDMLNQARGLRIMINELLANPSVKGILCADNSVDQDKMLAEGQITVVNYSQEMGDRDATALGLFFALSFNNACLRRPGTEDTRIPHFYVIDEFPVLLHPQFEKCVTLFRKFRVASCFALQTLDQMNKNDMTRYLSGVLQGNCAHQILYGRVNTTEMKQYQELAGTEGVVVEQEAVSQTSLTSLNPSYTYSNRTSISEENVLSGGEIRNRAFQEVTVFSVKNGSTVKPFHARLSFLEKAKKRKQKRYYVDWEELYQEYGETTGSIDDTKLLFCSGKNNVLLETIGTVNETTNEDGFDNNQSQTDVDDDDVLFDE